MAAKHDITRDDIMPMEAYVQVRKERRREITEVKRHRRLACGPDATFYFENYATMWHQVHEMLYIERGGEAQIADELHAYNPLVPKGRELVATVMFEIPDQERRHQVLSRLGGVEDMMTIGIDGETVRGVSEADLDRTTEAGKASSVQFVHFPFSDEQVAKFRQPGARIIVGIEHPEYAHMAVMPEAMRQALAADFD